MKRFTIIIFLTFIIWLLVSQCDYEKPKAIWNPDISYEGSPVITSMIPDGKEFFDEIEIKIVGENFSPISEENNVYFNNEKATLLSSSPTELVVKRPTVTGDSITVQVVVNNKVQVARFSPYKIEKVSEELGNFTRSNSLFSMAIDKDENVYTYAQGPVIYKITPDNEKTEWATPPMARTEQMRMGPGGYLYMAGKLDRDKGVFRIPPEGGETMEPFFILNKNFVVVEFDQNGLLYAAGKMIGMYVINSNGEGTQADRFNDFNIFDMRIVNDYIYVLANYTGSRRGMAARGLFKSQILGNGQLGEESTVFDWDQAGEYAEDKFLSFTISEDGDFYVGCANADPILIVHPDGTFEPLYPSLLIPSGATLLWGNGKNLFMVRGNDGGIFEGGRLFRIRLTKNGAPYYGRR